MATGTISSLGVGSGLDLQNILDQLRKVDEQSITTMQNDVTSLKTQLDEFTVVNNKLLTMKSAALDLSLSSTFLGRTISSSSESVLTATVSDGTSVQTTSVTVDRLASKSSWISAGVASQDAIVYVPTSQESTTGVTDPAVDVVAPTDGNLVITYGGSSTITVPVGPTATVSTMNDLVTAINNDTENVGSGVNGRMVTASTYLMDGQYYLRIESDTAGATGESHRVAITTNDTSLSFAPPTKTFAYQSGSTTVTLSVAADTTLSQLVDQINNDTSNPGVTASIIDSGAATDPYKMILQADDTGENNRISILAQVPDLTLSEQQGAAGASLNAQVTIDGIAYERQTNTISDVLSGVTMNLVSTGTASLTVANNNDNIKNLVTDLVTAYNDAVQEINAQVGYDEQTKKFGMLARTTLRDLPFDLESLMTTEVKADTDGNVTTLFDLGLTFNRDGTITLDTSTLDAKLASNSADVQEFFLGDSTAGITGFADRVNDYLREVTGGSGQIAAEKTAAQERIDSLETQITAETERLDKKYDLLAQQFVELDRYMNQMTSVSNYLTSQFTSLNNVFSGAGTSGSK